MTQKTVLLPVEALGMKMQWKHTTLNLNQQDYFQFSLSQGQTFETKLRVLISLDAIILL